MESLNMNRDTRLLSYDRDAGWKVARRFETESR